MIKRLEIERRRRGLSQVRLAGILGVHWTNVSELERGILTPLPGSPLVRKLI